MDVESDVGGVLVGQDEEERPVVGGGSFGDVAYDGYAGGPIADDQVMVFQPFIGVFPFSILVGTGGHGTVDGGDEQSVEHNQPQDIENPVLEILASCYRTGRFSNDGVVRE